MEYYELLRTIHAHLTPRTYVEIGVRNGASLALALPETLCIGVDPAMEILHPIGPRTKLFHETSDDFFAHHDLAAELDGLPVDLAFIDGMHLVEFALRDFANLERYCGPGSVILVHDCLPVDRETSTRERTTQVWSGDVWKLVVGLRRHRPDLTVTTLDVPPTGMAVITGLDLRSDVLRRRMARLSERLVALDYDDVLVPDRDGPLNRIGHDWPSVAAALDARLRPGAGAAPTRGRARSRIRHLGDAARRLSRPSASTPPTSPSGGSPR